MRRKLCKMVKSDLLIRAKETRAKLEANPVSFLQKMTCSKFQVVEQKIRNKRQVQHFGGLKVFCKKVDELHLNLVEITRTEKTLRSSKWALKNCKLWLRCKQIKTSQMRLREVIQSSFNLGHITNPLKLRSALSIETHSFSISSVTAHPIPKQCSMWDSQNSKKLKWTSSHR